MSNSEQQWVLGLLRTLLWPFLFVSGNHLLDSMGYRSPKPRKWLPLPVSSFPIHQPLHSSLSTVCLSRSLNRCLMYSPPDTGLCSRGEVYSLHFVWIWTCQVSFYFVPLLCGDVVQWAHTNTIPAHHTYTHKTCMCISTQVHTQRASPKLYLSLLGI